MSTVHEKKKRVSERTRVTLYMEAYLRKRLKLAAAQREVTIGQLVEEILLKNLPEVTQVEKRVYFPRHFSVDELLQQRDELQKRYPKGHDFGDAAKEIRESREERDEQLYQAIQS